MYISTTAHSSIDLSYAVAVIRFLIKAFSFPAAGLLPTTLIVWRLYYYLYYYLYC